MKKLVFLVLLLQLVSCANNGKHSDAQRNLSSEAKSPDALFSPHEGDEAFSRTYEIISSAKKYAHISVYSWSDSGLDQAIEQALKNGAKVRVVLHPDLKDSKKVLDVVPKLEKLGAEFKIAAMNMHEKFSLVDDVAVVNTSANFSGGAKNKYSENFIYHELAKDNSDALKNLLRDFKNEFIILWNAGKDVITNGESIAPALPQPSEEHVPAVTSSMALYSSSMNWSYVVNKPTSQAYKIGKYISLKKKTYTGSDEQTWVVRDVLIKHIEQAQKNIYLSLNHFNIRAVSDALVDAVKRGVDVRLTVDNQEYKSKPNDLEMTPQFVQDWYALKGKKVSPPVRVKYYSHEPSPRSWLLNHHKFVLVDYNVPGKTTLLSGSYNLSRTAEQNQFDNLVVYKGDQYIGLYKSFFDEFENQWYWNRPNDKAKEEMVQQFFTAKGGSYPVHVSEAVSLSWEEVMDLRSEVNKKAPGIFSGLTKNRDCMYYDPAKKSYWACPNK